MDNYITLYTKIAKLCIYLQMIFVILWLLILIVLYLVHSGAALDSKNTTLSAKTCGTAGERLEDPEAVWEVSERHS